MASTVMLVRALAYSPLNDDSLGTVQPNVARSVVNPHRFAEMPEGEDYHSRRSKKPSDKRMLLAPSWTLDVWDVNPFRHLIASLTLSLDEFTHTQL